MANWKQYKDERGFAFELRPYEKGEDLTKVNVEQGVNPDENMGFIARFPDSDALVWYIEKQQAEKSFKIEY